MNKIKLTFHGAAQEVGRSCIELGYKKTKIILDAGLKLTDEGTKFPRGMYDFSDIDGVFISHGHLDHCGALPLFDHNGLNAPIFCTKTTAKLIEIMLKDAYKIGKYHHENLGYFVENVQRAVRCLKRIELREKGVLKDIRYQFFNAGHIPGSSVIKIEAGNINLLYTGDINTEDTLLLQKANLDVGKVDILITETTYGDREHPNRNKEIKDFVKEIKNTIKKGGSVIIPSFAVGRAQELLLMLDKEKFKVPIYIDGMAIEVTQVAMQNTKNLKDPDKLKKAFKNVIKMHGHRQRMNALKKQGIFITTSGMLTGGPVIDYIKALHKDKNNSILLTGYQALGTNGRMLLETGKMMIDGFETVIKCHHRQFDFSAHAGMSQLKDIIKKTRPKKIILLHGDPIAMDSLKHWGDALDYDIIIPKLEEEMMIKEV